MINVMARIIVKPEAAVQMRDILRELAVNSRRESGCISYELYQQTGHRYVFQTIEQWLDQTAADAHLLTPHVAKAVAAAGPLFAGAPEIESYQLIEPA